MATPVPLAVVVMGVSGSGKSTVGAAIADRWGCTFVDADDLHPADNRAKMAAGVPLQDEDRWPWLDRVGTEALLHLEAGRSCVIACSALRRAYRERLRSWMSDVRFVHLHGGTDVIASRLQARAGHFMPPQLLSSQVSLLEPLEVDEAGLVLGLDREPAQLADVVVQMLIAACSGHDQHVR